MSRVKNTRKCPTCLQKINKLKKIYNELDECKNCAMKRIGKGFEELKKKKRKERAFQHDLEGLVQSQRYRTYAR